MYAHRVGRFVIVCILVAITAMSNSARSTPAAAFVTVAVAPACTDPPIGLVGWWPGDGNARDQSDGHHGTLVNGATFAPGLIDQAFGLVGASDYVDVGPGFHLDSMTLQAWVFIDPATNIGELRVISKGGNESSEPRKEFALKSSTVVYTGDNGKPGFEVFIDGEGLQQLSAPFPLSEGWHHLAGVRDTAAGRFELWVDGSIAASQTPTIVGAVDSDTPLLLGGYLTQDPWFENFSGLIDEAVVASRAFTATEIQASYAAGSAGMCKAQEPIDDASFHQTWARTDQPVADGRASRTWMWGPEPNTGLMHEAYAESPAGVRTVQYFDKSRMELSDPTGDTASPWYVTNGLLVVEMVTGQMQVGDATFEQREPAVVGAVGDPSDLTGPTYATFATLSHLPPLADDAVITQRVDRAGDVTTDPSLASWDVRAGPLVSATDHRVASVFWDFLHADGAVVVNEQYTEARLFDPWYYASGLPISEAFWSTVLVGGTPREVLVQAFERRVLTYTPENPEGWRVEAGNVGQHYYRWRYDKPVPRPTGMIVFSRTAYDPSTGAESQRSAVIVTADGSSEHVLTPANLIGTPRIAPDGSQVAWSERVGDRIDVFVANVDGADRHNLTAGLPNGGINPDWSSDGARIAFDANGQVWVIGVDGTSPYAVANGWGPRWSPDGSRLAFSVRTDPIGRYHGLATVRVDGSDFAGIAGCVSEFAWTPDSRAIVAFPGQYIGCSWASIFIAEADGTNLRPLELDLPDGAIVTNNIAFSADGTRVALVVYTGESHDIFVANSDFTDVRQISRSDESDVQPAWSPDGKWVAFTRYLIGGGDIFVVDVEDPENLWRVTADLSSSDEAPDW